MAQAIYTGPDGARSLRYRIRTDGQHYGNAFRTLREASAYLALRAMTLPAGHSLAVVDLATGTVCQSVAAR